jgi:hypothetical protein
MVPKRNVQPMIRVIVVPVIVVSIVVRIAVNVSFYK